MIHSVLRSSGFSWVLLLVGVNGLGCTVKGIQSPARDGGDARGRDGAKSDGLVAVAGHSGAGNSGSAGAYAGSAGFSSELSGGAGTTFIGSQTGTTLSSGGTTSSNSTFRSYDAGPFDSNRAESRDASGGTGGSASKLDAFLADVNKSDTRDAPFGRDVAAPDTQQPDARVPDVAIDTPVVTPHISSFTVSSGTVSGSEITVSAGKAVTFSWEVAGATTKEIDHGVGLVTGTSKAITLPSPSLETTTTYRLTISNANDASATFASAHVDVKITIVPLAITGFTASPPTINAGTSSTLVAEFLGSEASINNGVGAVSSGMGVIVSPSQSTIYRLTVKNRLNDSIAAELAVGVVKLDAGPDSAP